MRYSIESLKAMKIKDLNQLAIDIRETLIKNLSVTGGHLASNLGVVELTIALHYVFNSPRDLFFFDVSHQSYVHKLLTGRLDEFQTLRKYNGLSGFASRNESIHDIYEAGHSSTSISAALGYLEAKVTYPDLFDNAIAVIGDASLVNGLSLEALNYLGSKPEQKLIIIINDNEMGISKNVGGLAKTFNRIRIKGHFRLLRKLLPKRLKYMMKSMAYQNNILSGLGFKYLGIIDGHNLQELIDCLTYAKSIPNSVIIHVKTQKGKGYKFAEEDKTGIWHNTPPFEIDSGIQKSNSYEAFDFGKSIGQTLIKLANNHQELRVITPGMTFGSGLLDFSINHKNQFIDVGIGEENAVVLASSMAQAGLKPFVFIYSTFLQRTYDEIIHDLARLNQHVVLCIDRSGIVDGDGPTHQGIYDVAFLSTIPNIKIFTPSNLVEANQMINYTIENPDTYAIRYPKFAYDEGSKICNDLTKWQIIKPSSNRKYIISYGPNVSLLAKAIENDDIGLIKVLMVRPLDESFIKKLLIEGCQLYFYEEVVENNNLKNQVLAFANELYLQKQISSFFIKGYSLPNTYLPTGDKNNILKQYQLNIDNIIKEIKGE